ncbi:hypothetical protein I3843_12G057700 [Carya illinoinensis]|nr:hypothetical protein I3843_12G057700 [Carya illinoinensis]
MLEEQVANLLQRYLGNYVKGLNKEALKISVWQGLFPSLPPLRPLSSLALIEFCLWVVFLIKVLCDDSSVLC